MRTGLLLLVWLGCASAVQSSDWLSFRGANGGGVAPAGVRLPETFDSRTQAWTAKVPLGRSSPIVVGKQVVISGSDGERLLVLSYDTATGKERWRYERTRTRRNEIDGKRNDPASSTPAADSKAVYVFFHDFGLVALDLLSGKRLWELPLGPFLNNYGMASSPVVASGLVYLQVDQLGGSYLLAVSGKTGAVRWKAERPQTIEGWATPILTPRGELVTLSSNGLEAFSAETGQKLWLVPAPDSLMIPMPVMHGSGRVIATMRGGTKPSFPEWKSLMPELDANGNGTLEPQEAGKRFPIESFGIADPNRDGSITEAEWNRFLLRGVGEFGFTAIELADRRVVWRHQRGLPYVPSPVVYGDVVYSVRNGGILLSLDAETGAVTKEDRLPDAGGDYFSSLVAGDGKLFAISSDGKLTVLRAGRDWTPLARFDLDEPVAATPAIGDGAMFVRTHGHLSCYRAAR